jgi:YidC/Oxa1 family membrane protein insertase
VSGTAESAPATNLPATAAATTVPELRPATRAPREPETTAILSNGLLRLTLSSWGACVTEVELPAYSLTKGSPEPVLLDFRKRPALAYEGLAGLDADADFSVTVLSNGAVARLEAAASDGLRLVRTVVLGPRYEVMVEDQFVNDAPAARPLPPHAVGIGGMTLLKGESSMQGMDFLAIDTLASTGGEAVRHWVYKRWFSDDLTLADYFQEEPIRGRGCIGRPKMTRPLPHAVREKINRDMDWVAVKNKFFVQILAPTDGASGCDLIAERAPSSNEDPADSRTWDGVAIPSLVAAAARFEERSLAPRESYRRTFSYYVGPKEVSSIKPLGRHMKEVMDFGMLRWLCEVLVWSLRGLYAVIPNYGVAIILLTLIVRIVFWPLTHKGTESMKRMQELQPKLKELQQKYRDKPQKLQQETMALYREHKVNPLGGCLPMLIQIPVFFALFNVLRSAIELRFAGFLWVRDLSEAENLLHGAIPLIGSLNILPLIMAATQAWQQHLTPTGGDPAQQKMMMFMPIIMLIFLYTMPSGLVLYWTANQVMMIVQLLWQRRMKKP